MIDSKYNNYIYNKQIEFINDILKIIGFNSLDSNIYIPYENIQNETVSNYIENMLPALKTVFKTKYIRSISRKDKDKRFCINILRQLLKTIDYKLEFKVYSLIKNNTITSSTKYCIKKNI